MQTLTNDGAKSICIQAHVANYRNEHLVLPRWQRNGQRVWEGEYRSDLIESIMLGIDIPKLYLGILREHPGKKMIIDGGHRTRCLVSYVRNQFAWETNDTKVYYSEVPMELRGNRTMTPEERAHFDNYELTLVCYKNVAEKQARQIFNRLQNAAPMAMADVVNSYEADLVEFFREEVRPRLLNGNETYAHLKEFPLKHPDTNEDLYQLLSWYTIVNPCDTNGNSPEVNALKNIEMGKGREGNRCFRFLREFDDTNLTHGSKSRFMDAIDDLIVLVKEIPKINNSAISSLLYANLYMPNFSFERFKELCESVKKYKSLDNESNKLFKSGSDLAQIRKRERDELDAMYNGDLSKWQKSKQQAGVREANMLIRRDIIMSHCIASDEANAPYVEGEALEPFVMSA